jgi:hypothetical protein
MKTDEIPYGEIASRAIRHAGGSQWKAYEIAKREVRSLLNDAPQQAIDSAERRIADALHI